MLRRSGLGILRVYDIERGAFDPDRNVEGCGADH